MDKAKMFWLGNANQKSHNCSKNLNLCKNYDFVETSIKYTATNLKITHDGIQSSKIFSLTTI